ncbi:hypothetical protein A4R44_09296 [Amycolatopsis sp. M39]|nr:hypothetical protein A4R44_09296 [Amycolatopsis sp. M39]
MSECACQTCWGTACSCTRQHLSFTSGGKPAASLSGGPGSGRSQGYGTCSDRTGVANIQVPEDDLRRMPDETGGEYRVGAGNIVVAADQVVCGAGYVVEWVMMSYFMITSRLTRASSSFHG